MLYVKNVEPPQPAVASQPSSPPGEPVAAKTAVPYRDLIHAAAARHDVAPELVESVIRVESNFEARAVSPKGARGLMQLMPTTAAQLGVRNVFDARQNTRAGSDTSGIWSIGTAAISRSRSRRTTRAWRRSRGMAAFPRTRKRGRTWRVFCGCSSARGYRWARKRPRAGGRRPRARAPRHECSTATRRPMVASSTPTFRSISSRPLRAQCWRAASRCEISRSGRSRRRSS